MSGERGEMDALMDLADTLVRDAQRARRLVVDGDVDELRGMLDTVRNRLDTARGVELLLLEVAAAYLRTLVRTDLGTTELALREFVIAHPDGGAQLIEQLLDRGRISKSEVDDLASDLRAAFMKLVDVGAVRDLDERGFDLRPSQRSVARDLISPPTLRAWRRVEDCREQIRFQQMRPDAASAFMASQLGLTIPEAQRHLRAAPIVISPPSPASSDARAAEPDSQDSAELFALSQLTKPRAEVSTVLARGQAGSGAAPLRAGVSSRSN